MILDSNTLVRTVRFQPYRRGAGPTFTLRLYWAGQCDDAGRCVLGYKLTSERKVIFQGADYCAHVRHSLETDRSIVDGIMGFLTLRPGDTDDDYFAAYTPEQRAYCDAHAESLSCEAMTRFGEGE